MATKYNLTLLFNGETFNKRATNLKEAILALKPEALVTEVYVKVKPVGSKEDDTERKLSLIQGKKLFNNEDFMTVFINNLLLT
jgi:hypothetical protein